VTPQGTGRRGRGLARLIATALRREHASEERRGEALDVHGQLSLVDPGGGGRWDQWVGFFFLFFGEFRTQTCGIS